MGKKGFIITVDSFLGVTLMLLFILLAFFFVSRAVLDSWNILDLKGIVFDEGSVLEKSGVFENAIKSSSSEELLTYLNSTPSNYCFSATIFSSDLSVRFYAIKGGCVNNVTNLVSYERTIVIRDANSVSYFLARTEGWVK